MRIRCISCEVFTREICAAIAGAASEVDVSFLPKGLHSVGAERMARRIQDEIAAVPAGRYDAIALAYGLCNNGIRGLASPHTRLVVPRAHDCITLFLGSRQRYQDAFDAHPDTYWLTSGWIERANADGELGQLSIEHRQGLNLRYQQLVERYGEDNAQYLQEVLHLGKHLGQVGYIAMGVEPDDRFEAEARRRAAAQGRAFRPHTGDLSLLRRLLDGPWNEDFLILEPTQAIRPSHDGGIIGVAG